MPFQSGAQARKCFAMKARGENGSWDCSEWSHATDYKHLPKGKKKKTKKATDQEGTVSTVAMMARQAAAGPILEKFAAANGLLPQDVELIAKVAGVDPVQLVGAARKNPAAFYDLSEKVAGGQFNQGLGRMFGMEGDEMDSGPSRSPMKDRSQPLRGALNEGPRLSAPVEAPTPAAGAQPMAAAAAGGAAREGLGARMGTAGKAAIERIKAMVQRGRAALPRRMPGGRAGLIAGGLGAGATALGLGGAVLNKLPGHFGQGGEGAGAAAGTAAPSAGAIPAAAGGAARSPAAAPSGSSIASAAGGLSPTMKMLLAGGAVGLGGYGAYKALGGGRKKEEDKAAADGPVLELVRKKAVTKLASTMRENAAQAVCQYLDKVASALPLEKQGAVRTVQSVLSQGRTLSSAIKVAYPHLSGEMRGHLASRLVRATIDHINKRANAECGPMTYNGPVQQGLDWMKAPQ